jgi:hypothetical protein
MTAYLDRMNKIHRITISILSILFILSKHPKSPL